MKSLHFVCFLLLPAMAMSLLSCQKSKTASPVHPYDLLISGRVADQDSDRGMAGLTVRLSAAHWEMAVRAITDEEGNYILQLDLIDDRQLGETLSMQQIDSVKADFYRNMVLTIEQAECAFTHIDAAYPLVVSLPEAMTFPQELMQDFFLLPATSLVVRFAIERTPENALSVRVTTRDLNFDQAYDTWAPLELDLHAGDLAGFCVARNRAVEVSCLFQEYTTDPLIITRELLQVDTVEVMDGMPDALLCVYE